MGRRPGDADKLSVTDETRPGFESVLELLGVGPLSLTDAPPYEDRARYTIDLYRSERDALDDAALGLGISARGGARLARAIVRSWLVTPWLHPEQLELADLGDGHRWSDSLASITREAEWPSQRPDDRLAPLVAALRRLPDADLRRVIEAVQPSPSKSRR